MRRDDKPHKMTPELQTSNIPVIENTATGVDKVTADEYAANLDVTL